MSGAEDESTSGKTELLPLFQFSDSNQLITNHLLVTSAIVSGQLRE